MQLSLADERGGEATGPRLGGRGRQGLTDRRSHSVSNRWTSSGRTDGGSTVVILSTAGLRNRWLPSRSA